MTTRRITRPAFLTRLAINLMAIGYDVRAGGQGF